MMPANRKQISEEAADWLVRLTADETTTEKHQALLQAFERWKRADPQHAETAARMEKLISSLQSLREKSPTQVTHAVLNKTGRIYRQRRKVQHYGALTLLLLTLLVLPGWMWTQGLTPGLLLADLHTGKGQWQTHTLDDGSQIQLSGQTAINLKYDASQRLLQLRQGKILVDVAKDPARPFIIETPQGRVQALGTRFTLEQEGTETQVTLLESRVRVSPGQLRQHQDIKAGERLEFSAEYLGPVKTINADALLQAWNRKLMVLDDEPLTRALEQLARHHRGLLRYKPEELAGYRASGVLPLDHPEQALTLLAASLNLQVRQISPWITIISPAQ